MDNKNNWYTSIIVIAICFAVFTPLGCLLLYLRWCNTKGKYKANSMTLLTVTILLFLIGLAGTIAFIESHDISDFLLAWIVFVIPGIICLLFWFKRKNKYKEYKKYLDYINAHKRVELDSLCNKLNVDYDTATNVLTEMINNGLINGYLNDDELITNNKIIDKDILMEENNKVKETKVVKCKECGAKNTIVVGKSCECEYCGSLLE